MFKHTLQEGSQTKRYFFGPVKFVQPSGKWFPFNSKAFTTDAFQKVYLKRPDGSRDPFRYYEFYLQGEKICQVHYFNKVLKINRRLRMNPRFE